MEKRTKIYIIVLVAVAVAGLLIYTFFTGANSANIQFIGKPVTQLATMSKIANNATLAKATGSGALLPQEYPTAINGTPFTNNGKPEVLYIGGDYCPYCAATRWELVLALMRFGTFGSLHYMASTTSDVYPATPTFTFRNSSYSSQYLSFVGVEMYSLTGSVQQNLTAQQSTIIHKYSTSGSIPFIDFGNKSIQQGADYSPGLIYQLNWDRVIAQLNNTNSSVSQSIIGGTNVFTAQICKADGMQPSNVCNQAYIGMILNGT